MENKILTFETIQSQIKDFKRIGKKVVHCHGLFHFLHVGHFQYLKRAKQQGDVLVVSVFSDKYIPENENMQFDENMRAEALTSLDFVDAVVINPFENVAELIERMRPDIFFEGFESDKPNRLFGNRIEKNESLFAKWGVEHVIMQEDNFASTAQINRYLTDLSDDIENYMRLFQRRYDFDSLKQTIGAMQDLRVLIIGDTIIDDYQYCTTIGKSSKDPTLALKFESYDVFPGGVLAVANHVAGFVGQVDLITILGEKKSYEEFIRTNLKQNIRPYFFYKKDAPTLIKRRFLDGHSMNKLLEVYVMDDTHLNGDLGKKFLKFTQSKLSEYDLVIAADFGHGAINKNLKRLLSREAPFLAVNAQSNAGNRGFNNITKYPSADYITIAEHEIRLEKRDLTGKIRPMMDSLSDIMNCRKMTVTRGLKGCMILDNEGSFVQVPRFSQKVVDRVGAGDALFAVTSLAAFLNASCEIVGFLGNVAGSLAIEIMGNQNSIDHQSVTEFIKKLYSGSAS
jgi:cytidyltransferase-like protein